MDEPKEPRKPIELRPQPKATRLNRLTLALVGLAAIAVLWIGMWAVGRRPGGEGEPQPRRQTSRPLDVDRLRRATPPATAPAPAQRLPPPPPAPTARPSRTSGRTDPEAVRAQRAVDASPVVAAFGRPTFYAEISDTPAKGTGGFAPQLGEFPQARPEADEAPRVEDPGLYGRKAEFLEAARDRRRPAAAPAVLEAPVPDTTLIEGTLLPAILKTGLQSDLPGQTQALIRANVYDSLRGRHLLIPSGTIALGEYDHRVAWGQRRVLVAWHRLVLPDGSSLDLAGMPGADLAGQAGIGDRVNNHFVRTFGSAMLLSAFSAGAQLSQPQESSSLGQAASARQVVAAALGQEINRTAGQILRRNLQVEPTLVVRPGYEFFIQLTADLILPSSYAPADR